MPNTAAMLEQINLSSQELDLPEPNNAINNVYKLPNIGRAVRYIHAKAGFPNRAIWLKSIRKGNYILVGRTSCRWLCMCPFCVSSDSGKCLFTLQRGT